MPRSPKLGTLPPPCQNAPGRARVEELEKALLARQDTVGMLGEIQRLALDAGLQMTKFAPGAELPV